MKQSMGLKEKLGNLERGGHLTILLGFSRNVDEGTLDPSKNKILKNLTDYDIISKTPSNMTPPMYNFKFAHT